MILAIQIREKSEFLRVEHAHWLLIRHQGSIVLGVILKTIPAKEALLYVRVANNVRISERASEIDDLVPSLTGVIGITALAKPAAT